MATDERELLKKVIFSPITGRSGKKIIQIAMDKLYGEMVVPRECVNLEERRAPNGGLMVRPVNF